LWNRSAAAYGQSHDPIDQYVRYRADGHLIVRGLVAPEEVGELLDHMAEASFERRHMLHRRLEIHERFLLHPRVGSPFVGFRTVSGGGSR
jgi:hypothetical protein